MRRYIIFLVAIVCTIIGYGFLISEKKPDILTTTVDIEKRIVSESETTDSVNDNEVFGVVISALNTVATSLSETLGDDMTMLAAAADPSVAFVKINPGMRKEEIAAALKQKLSWSDSETMKFLDMHKILNTSDAEGYYYPDTYILSKDISGYEAGKLMVSRFNSEVMSRYATSTKKKIDVDTALKIASIIDRESSGKNDMRLISGIIWNRIFKNMSLDMDATLQYAKGNEEAGWWPKVESKDKFIDSPYNTYQNKGLTPTPISNPNLASINAALNPQKTNCLFYIHDKYRRIHCSATYKEHVRKIALYYGK